MFGGVSFADCEAWRVCTVSLFLVLVPCTAEYFILAATTSGACYVEPCMQGIGTEELWKVNKGISTACVAGGFVAAAQAVAGLAFFARYDPKRSHFLIGLFVGLLALVAFTMLGQSAMWMAEWNLIYDLSQIRADSDVLLQSGRRMVVRHELRHRFRALALLAAFCCLIELLLVWLLAATRKYAVGFFRLRGGAEASERTRFRQTYNLVPQRTAVDSPGDSFQV
ncbi:hypothetical protein M885DRAFT_565940 [Pelagophyceae sp. CCMP2097]|nr:hypothetical protein M885DRAFT_565940 [Pelagophyceae sp. CCMP2097]|mmetsp:Transcript_3766/g.11475  ORF Transcript_3766/g.11475 Transcript_3766/m.11475 type:complete len:224 (+) Transcript_3766:229-900(+)